MKIPKIFHFAWFGGEIPEEYQYYISTWLELHPDWVARLWHEENLPDLRHRQLFEEAQHPAYKAEIVRLEAVYQEGGVWVDADFECFKSIDHLLSGITAFSAWQYEDRARSGAVGCGIFGAVPWHPFLGELVDGVAAAWKPDRMSLGPWYFTPLALKHGIFLFEKKFFYPYDSNEKHRKKERFPEAYAAHHWAGTWVAHHKATLAREKSQ